LLLQSQRTSPDTTNPVRSQPSQASTSNGLSAPQGKVAASPSQVHAFYGQLIAGKLPEAEAKRTLVAWLEGRAPEPPTKEYWRAVHLSDARERLARFQFRESARATLLSTFGPSATDDPAFAAVFAPYAREFPFLAPATQRTLETIYAARDNALLTADFPATGASAQSVAIEIEALFTAEELEQFRLRTSALARQLLATGFSFSEQEFKAAFQALAASTTNAEFATTSAFRMGAEAERTTQRLRAALGNRFDEYQKLQDPRYQILTAVSQSFGVATTRRDAAYAAVREAEAAIEDINRGGPILMPDSRKKLNEITQQREQRLKQLLGNQGYEVAARSLGLNGSMAFPVGAPSGGRVAVKEFP
jgi:hypothetical protein